MCVCVCVCCLHVGHACVCMALVVLVLVVLVLVVKARKCRTALQLFQFNHHHRKIFPKSVFAADQAQLLASKFFGPDERGVDGFAIEQFAFVGGEVQVRDRVLKGGVPNNLKLRVV